MSTSNLEWMVIAGGFVCFSMAWGIGANDVANAFATSVGARAISLKQATIIAAIFEFAGAFLLGSAVTDTVRKGITDYERFEDQADILMLGMFCALCSSSLWLFFATKYSMPVSTTQSIVGSIIGFALVVHGFDAVSWDSVINIIIFWLASPVGSGIIALIVFVPTRNFLLRRDDAYSVLLKIWPLYVWIVVFIMTLFLLFKGLKRIDYSAEWGEALWISAVCGVGCAAIAWLLLVKSGLLEKYVENKVKEDAKWEKERAAVYKQYQIINNNKNKNIANNENVKKQSVGNKSVSSIPSATPREEDNLVNNNSMNTQNGIVTVDIDNDNDENDSTPSSNNNSEGNIIGTNGNNAPKQRNNSNNKDQDGKSKSKLSLLASKVTRGVNVDVYDDLQRYELEIQANAEQFDSRVERSFNWLQVASASLDIFAHGSNDIANAVAPFAAIVAIYNKSSVVEEVNVPWYVSFIGSIGLVIGLGTYGYNIIKAIGVRLVSMSSTRGYSIELASALMVIIASYYGYPASTTHCQIGATFGIGLLEATNRNDKSKLHVRTAANWKLLAIVFLGWILTLLVSAATCAAIFCLLAYSPCL